MKFNSLFLKNNHAIKFFKFGFIGGLTALIYFFILWITESIFSLHYLLAISVAYFFSTSFHFFMNRNFTFSASQGSHFEQFGRYAFIWGANYLITMFIVNVSVNQFLLTPYQGVCISVPFTMVVGYVLGFFWVFDTKKVDS